MNGIFLCGCGTRTRYPYTINEEKFCVICASKLDSALVSRTAARDWQMFNNGRKARLSVPSSRFVRREGDD